MSNVDDFYSDFCYIAKSNRTFVSKCTYLTFLMLEEESGAMGLIERT